MNRDSEQLNSLKLVELDSLPLELLELDATELHQQLSGPTLFHLPGRRTQPLFVSVLLHGNETSGWLAIRSLLKEHLWDGKIDLPRSLSLFIGNVEAARQRERRLDDQPDYNRIWPGSDAPLTAEGALMAQVITVMTERQPFAAIDIHNNTGVNPHYACVNRLDHRYLHLASLFARTVVYFIRPRGVCSAAFAELCPAVTLECGQVGEPRGVAHALEFLQAALQLVEIPRHAVPAHDIDLFHTMAQVKVRDECAFSFVAESACIRFAADLDHLNFQELPEGTVWAWLRDQSEIPLDVTSESGEEVTSRYFIVTDGELRTRIPVMPSMLTLNSHIIRQDCLCYLMERIPIPVWSE